MGVVAELWRLRIHLANPCAYTEGMSKPSPARYRTTNWSSYNASLRKRGSLLIWVDKNVTWLAPRDGRRGRPAVFSDAAIQFYLSIKILFKLPLRQTAGMVASLLKLAGLDWPVPDFSTLCRRQRTLAVQVPYRRSDAPSSIVAEGIGKLRGCSPWHPPSAHARPQAMCMADGKGGVLRTTALAGRVAASGPELKGG